MRSSSPAVSTPPSSPASTSGARRRRPKSQRQTRPKLSDATWRSSPPRSPTPSPRRTAHRHNSPSPSRRAVGSSRDARRSTSRGVERRPPLYKRMRLNAEIDGEKLTLEVRREGGRVLAEVGGRRYELEARALGAGQWLLVRDGRVYECRAGAEPGGAA